MTNAEHLADDVLDTLAEWLPERRWFHAQDAGAALTVIDQLELTDPTGDARVLVLLLGIGHTPRPPYLQVPLTLRRPGSAPPSAVHVGTAGSLEIFDGPTDPGFVRAWLAAADESGRLSASLDAGAARPVAGEQSNSSVIIPGADGGPGAILKVFRGVWPGRNPDVDVPAALARAGFGHVPAPLAWLEHRWDAAGSPAAASPEASETTNPRQTPSSADGSFAQLGVLSTFVPGAQDGFELACATAARGESFESLASELGSVLAQLHEELVAALPIDPPRQVEADRLAQHLRERLEWAIAEVPALAPWEAAVLALLDQLAGLDDLPFVQRIHGDLHLGQLLRSPTDWFVLDFEGEPLVPLTERAQPDLALRDVAGILRSFDYAAARVEADDSWTLAARTAFLAAYRGAAPSAASRSAALALRTYEVDKALYEVVYETQNRPDWAQIPVRALHRLVGAPRAATGGGRVGT